MSAFGEGVLLHLCNFKAYAVLSDVFLIEIQMMAMDYKNFIIILFVIQDYGHNKL